LFSKFINLIYLTPIIHFGSPIELYIKNSDGTYLEFRNQTGQIGYQEQAWSVAAALDLLL